MGLTRPWARTESETVFLLTFHPGLAARLDRRRRSDAPGCCSTQRSRTILRSGCVSEVAHRLKNWTLECSISGPPVASSRSLPPTVPPPVDRLDGRSRPRAGPTSSSPRPVERCTVAGDFPDLGGRRPVSGPDLPDAAGRHPAALRVRGHVQTDRQRTHPSEAISWILLPPTITLMPTACSIGRWLPARTCARSKGAVPFSDMDSSHHPVCLGGAFVSHICPGLSATEWIAIERRYRAQYGMPR